MTTEHIQQPQKRTGHTRRGFLAGAVRCGPGAGGREPGAGGRGPGAGSRGSGERRSRWAPPGLYDDTGTGQARHPDDSGKAALRDEGRLGWFMDPALTGLGGPEPRNREQFHVRPTGTLHNRPSAHTAVPGAGAVPAAGDG
ncbi:hypothetical protein [Streptomyces sp. SID13726]|uniref:hypothetical protein n=1 Tax=Streptomyces sp. SID13726 TaxID=2706058 RepID=UPI001EF31934|nr:hypothetical protein [Streptomyces sp. SID13726]